MSLKKKTKIDIYQTKRGDTIIEVMFAIAVFCLVAVISIAMMNMGVAQAEGSLEVVTTRNELNAQAEALRFIHSSYIAERTLPDPTAPGFSLAKSPKYQIYTQLWQTITDNAIEPGQLGDFAKLGELVVGGCERIYETDGTHSSLLSKAHGFVINTRDITTRVSASTPSQVNPTVAYIPSFGSGNSHRTLSNEDPIFAPSPLNARLVFYQPTISGDSTESDFGYNSQQNRVLKSEGIWVIAVKGVTDMTSALGTEPEFYDFYIQSCWNGPTGNTPQSIDTVIRLYNPKGAL